MLEEASDRSDEQLLQAMQEGDQSALACLYDRHHEQLFSIALAILRNRQDAEDLLHDVFLACWHKAQQFDAQRGSAMAWLVTCMRNRALDRLRVLARIRTSAALLPEAAQHCDIAALSDDEERAQLAMKVLTEKQRKMIEMSYFAGMTHKEIAASCDIALGTVKSRIAAALVKLRRQLDRLVESENDK